MPKKTAAKKRASAKPRSGATRARKAPTLTAKRARTKQTAASEEAASDASRRIDARIAELADWRGAMLAEARRLIREADPEVVEEVKWVKPTNPWGVPTWTHDGIVCTGEVYKETVKLTFARGASVPDPSRLFNASLEGNTRRAIDLREGDALPAEAFRGLVRAAVEGNRAVAETRARKRT